MNLNSEFDIPEPNLEDEDTVQLFTHPEPNHLPELRDDLNIIAATEAALEDLKYLVDDIRSNHGMCQKFALEAERIMPGFLNDKVSVGYFTQAPSATQLRYAMEEIDKKKAAGIAAIAAALLALLYKVYTWFTNKDKSDIAESSPIEVKNKVKEQEEVIADIYKSAQELNAKTSGQLNDIVKDIAHKDSDSKSARLTDHIDGLVFDLLSPNGEVFKEIHGILKGNDFNKILHVYNHQLEYMEHLGKDLIAAMERDIHLEALANVKKFHAEMTKDDGSIFDIRDGRGKFMSPRAVSDKLHGLVMSLSDKHQHRINNVTDSFDHFTKINRSELVSDFVDLRFSIDVDLQRYSKRFETFSNMVIDAKFTQKDPVHGFDHTLNVPSGEYDGKNELIAISKIMLGNYVGIAGIVKTMELVLIDKFKQIMGLFHGLIKEIDRETKRLEQEYKASHNSSDKKKLEDLKEFQKLFDEEFNQKEGFLDKLKNAVSFL